MRLVSRTYMICEGGSANELARDVDNATKGGWQMQGGVSISNVIKHGSTTEVWYAQAMVFESWVDEEHDAPTARSSSAGISSVRGELK